MKRFLRVGQISGAVVYLHWSVILIAVLILLGNAANVAAALFLIAAFLGLMLLHEWGHLLAARRRGYEVWSIELYPLHGFTRYAAPHSHYDACVVAWGGVLAQLAVALPLVACAGIFGFTSVGVINGLIAIFGYYSILIAIFNLLPASRLDGATAWQIVPYLWRRKPWLSWQLSWLRWRINRGRPAPSERPVRPKGGWMH